MPYPLGHRANGDLDILMCHYTHCLIHSHLSITLFLVAGEGGLPVGEEKSKVLPRFELGSQDSES